MIRIHAVVVISMTFQGLQNSTVALAWKTLNERKRQGEGV
jgi:hypothetical protein